MWPVSPGARGGVGGLMSRDEKYFDKWSAERREKRMGGGVEVIKRENVGRGFLAENILKNVNGIKRIERESLCKRD